MTLRTETILRVALSEAEAAGVRDALLRGLEAQGGVTEDAPAARLAQALANALCPLDADPEPEPARRPRRRAARTAREEV